jgi:hypothetical protein
MRRSTKVTLFLGVSALVGQSLLGCAGVRPGAEMATRHEMAALPGSAEAPSRHDLEATLRDEGVVSPRALDFYILSAFSAGPDSSLLWSSFRSMLAASALYQSDTARAHLERHVALSELLYKDAPGPEAGLDVRASHALRWWMEQENAPAAAVNERLVAHLERVAFARERYPTRVSATGLDARGETWVRFGQPSRTRKVRFNEADLLLSYLREGLQVRQADFPDNEIWLYDQLGPSGLFLFVEGPRNSGYYHGSVNDLLPRQLRNRGVSGSARGGEFAFAALRTLRYIFSQLAMYHPSYSSRYDTVSQYVGWQEERAFVQRSGIRQQAPVAGYDAMTQTLDSVLRRNEREDERLGSRRDAGLPDEVSDIDPAVLPVNLRALRWLTPQGTTTVQLYWSLELEGLASCIRDGRYVPALKRSRLVSYSPRFGRDTVVLDSTTAAAPWDNLFRFRFLLDGPIEQLALQVDGVGDEAPDRYVGSCTGIARTGSLAPLDPRVAGVELSDLLPFRVDDVIETREHFAASGFSIADLEPYVRPNLDAASALGVYFEVYTLTDLTDDYLIEYQITKRTPGGILQRGRTRTSLFHARRAVVDQRLPAAFLIDSAEWRGAREIDIIVTVTNLVTGAEISRTLPFKIDG